jgi:hypothetical protein
MTRQLCTRKRPCPKCGQVRLENGHDPCIAELPGVLNACCGHGAKAKAGYVMFGNGVVLRGNFDVEHFDCETGNWS